MTAGGDLVERTDVGQVLVGEQVRRQRLTLRGAGVIGDAVQVLAREHPLGQRRERDAADAGLVKGVEQALLDPAVEHGVRGLVDQERCTECPEDLDGLAGALRRCLLYTSPSPRDRTRSRMPSSA